MLKLFFVKAEEKKHKKMGLHMIERNEPSGHTLRLVVVWILVVFFYSILLISIIQLIRVCGKSRKKGFWNLTTVIHCMIPFPLLGKLLICSFSQKK